MRLWFYVSIASVVIAVMMVGVVLGSSGFLGDQPDGFGGGAGNSPPSGIVAATTPTLTATPSSGYVGTMINFTGAGFAHKSAVTVSWVEGTACTATTNSTGGFVCSYQMTAYPIGAWTFTATDAASNSASTTFTVIPELTVSPTSGPAGTTVTFTATGYDGSQYLDLTWMSGSVQACYAGTNGYGSLSCSYTVTPGTPKGTYTFTGTDQSSHTAMTSFDVTYTPTLKASPGSGVIGTTITFTGAGYATSSAITVSWAEGTACTATSNSTGGFSCTFQMPQYTVGPQTFSASDASSGTATTTFTVIPELTVSPTSGPAGTVVTFTATGYDGSQYLDLTWMSGLVQACYVGTNGYGTVSCTYTITPAPAGKYTFTGTDQSSRTAMATFTVGPTLTISPATGAVGTVVAINGSSYAASSAVTVTWTGGTACSSTTNAAGDFSCDFTIPTFTIGGTYTFTGTDAASHKATTSFTDTPHLTVSSLSGIVGTKVTFKGSGFASNSSLSIGWTHGVACTATTATAGTFSCTFKVPADPDGAYTFNATDANFNSATTKFTVTPSLVATPASGLVGSSVVFSGTGFTAKSLTNVTWPGGLACAATSSAVGSFSCEFVIPATTNGLYTFTGTDAKGRTAAATFTVDASLAASPTSGPVGTTVTFTGLGFAGSSAVTVSWSGGTACLAISNATGNFTCTFTIPSGTTTGTYTFTATDAQSNSAKVTFDVT